MPSKNSQSTDNFEVLTEPVEALEEPALVLQPVENNSSENDYISFNDILNGDGYNGN